MKLRKMHYPETTVTVMMGVYNDEEYLDQAVESILSQTHEELEFIIVDDCSSDGSYELLQEYEDTDERIVLLRNEKNRGLTYSLNRALEAANGKYVARQDADDISEETRIEKQLDFMERNPEIPLVGTGAYLIDGEDRRIGKRLTRSNLGRSNLLEKNDIIHGSVLGRRDVFLEFDGYDEFFRYAQDYDLWLRMTRKYDLMTISYPLYNLRIHDESVYFSEKDESALYSMFARHLATGEVGKQVENEVRGRGIDSYYEYLSKEQKKDFHLDLAVRYLRYGHMKQAREECQKASKNSGTFDMRIPLLQLLSHSPRLTESVRRIIRLKLNLRVRLNNLFTR